MERNADNVILFPKWKQTLEQESLLALEQKEYEKALVKLNQLLDYDNQKHEIIMGKIICLMELDQYDEAQDLCETLIKHKDKNYYHYVHIYLTILFQTNQYHLLMEQVEFVLADKSIPSEMIDMFQQLYEMSKNMQYEIHIEKSHYFVEELAEAVHIQDHQKQWRLIEKLKHLKVTPPKELYTYLINDAIHPVVKTSLFQWLQQSEIEVLIEVHKENGQMTVQPASLPPLTEHAIMKQMILLLSNQEQKNPSLYYFMEKLLYRYFYVCYPILPGESDVQQIAQALRLLGEAYLRNESVQVENLDKEIERYIHEIQLCETLYLSILDDSL